MTTALPFFPYWRVPRESTQRFGISLGLSIVAHVALIAMFAGLLKPMLTPLAGRVGQALPIEVALVGVRPIAFAPPPEVSPAPTELTVSPMPASAAAVSALLQPPVTPAQASTPVANPFGVSVQTDANASDVSADVAPPPGNTSVGPITDSERLGHAQALRLAQRFPRAAKQAQLREPLIVPYPPNAARAHAEARIAALVVLDTTGKVTETTLFPDEPLFGPTILEAVKGARFAPAEDGTKPIPNWILLEFVFKLGHPSVTPRAKV